MRGDNKKALKLSATHARLIRTSAEIALNPLEDISYHHTVFCQTSMPYRDPGQNLRIWERRQGAAYLRIEAGSALDPHTQRFVDLGLPFGPKARLILAHLNAEALKQGSATIEVEDSLTAFIRRIQDPLKDGKSGPNGKEVRSFKDHLSRLSSATVRLAVMTDERALQINTQIVVAFDLWFAKNEHQRVLWPSTIRLSQEYYDSLSRHAVPLDERALAALSHSAMALDIYAWLAQRLHRIPTNRPQFIPWAALNEQFGGGYARLRDFRRAFQQNLRLVLTQYGAAQIEADERGLTLAHSLPPVPPRIFVVPKPLENK